MVVFLCAEAFFSDSVSDEADDFLLFADFFLEVFFAERFECDISGSRTLV